MSAIDFVVRGDAGVVQRGGLAGPDGAASVVVAQGQDISLNLQRSNILSYVRQGQALEITLVDGRVVLVEGFFTPDGAPVAELFISANGEIAQVDLVAGEGSLLYAQYVDGDTYGKWSPDDDLYFIRGSEVALANVVPADDSAGMLATPFLAGLGGLVPTAALGAAGLGSAVLLSRGGGDDPAAPGDTNPGAGGGGGGGGGTPPTVTIDIGGKGSSHVVNAADHADGVDIGGTGTPGASGTVTIGEVSKQITIDGQGNWKASFDPSEIKTGEYEDDITVVVNKDGGTATATDKLVVDTDAHVTFDPSQVEGDGIVNRVEESDGFTLTGTTEPGSAVVVSFGGVNYTATVTGDTWTLDVPAGTVAAGEYDLNVTVSATDKFGNTAGTSGVVRIDTDTAVTIDTSATGGDGTVNAVERDAGITVNGVAEPGATVVVTLGTVAQTVTATASGTWSASYAAADVPAGTYDLPVTAVSTDVAGNTATASGTVQVDTELSVTVNTATVEGDGTVNAAERADGVTLNGTTEPGATVVVDFAGAKQTVTADAGGIWQATYAAGSVPQGTTQAAVSVTATDAAGNIATASGNVAIDTELAVTVDTSKAGGDGTINFAEHPGGLTLTGTTEALADVKVTFNGVERTTKADAFGNWSADWPSSAVPTGEQSVAVNVTATDAAGNTAQTSGTVKVDTLVNRLAFSAVPVEGDDIVNNAEAADGITLNGVVEAGSTVMVTFQGVSRAATVTAAGDWTVSFAGSEIPKGEYTATVTIDATDAAGNTASLSDTFKVDTKAPDAVDIEDYTDSTAGVKGFTMLTPDGAYDVSQVKFDGSAPVAKTVAFESNLGSELGVRFAKGDEVPDGSHLVVRTRDTSGNENATLFVLDDTATNAVDFPLANLAGFKIGAIDLELAEDSQLTISTQELKDLSSNDNTLVIHGGVDDKVVLQGTATAAGKETINGQQYDVYTLGDAETRLIINDDIGFSTV